MPRPRPCGPPSSPSLPLSAVTAVVYGALRSAGDVFVPMVYSVATSVLVLVPASLVFLYVVDLGVAGVFWALVAAEAVKAGLLLARWLRGLWQSRASLVSSRAETADDPADAVAV